MKRNMHSKLNYTKYHPPTPHDTKIPSPPFRMSADCFSLLLHIPQTTGSKINPPANRLNKAYPWIG